MRMPCPKVGFDKLIPAFNATAAGKGVAFQQSYGASGDQSRKVEAGRSGRHRQLLRGADVTRLVDAGLVDKSWNAGEHKGIPFGSVVTIVVRKGNPKGIKDWDDLLKPGIEVVTPNPFSSGSAKWNLLAPYAAKSQGGKDPKAGLAYISSLVQGHVKTSRSPAERRRRRSSRAAATRAQLRERGDLRQARRGARRVPHPPETFKIEKPVAVLSKSPNAARAKAFNDFLYTPEAQRLWAEAGFRPVDPTVAQEFAADFPAPQKLGRSTTSAAGRPSTTRSSRRMSAPSPSSTTRPPGRDGNVHRDPGRQGRSPHPHSAPLPPASRPWARVQLRRPAAPSASGWSPSGSP